MVQNVETVNDSGLPERPRNVGGAIVDWDHWRGLKRGLNKHLGAGNRETAGKVRSEKFWPDIFYAKLFLSDPLYPNFVSEA